MSNKNKKLPEERIAWVIAAVGFAVSGCLSAPAAINSIQPAWNDLALAGFMVALMSIVALYLVEFLLNQRRTL